MKYFRKMEILRLLRATDRHLKKPFTVVIVGGAAAALSFKAMSGTLDIDTATSLGPIEDALSMAAQETGLDMPVGRTLVFEAPYEYESRLKPIRVRGMTKLRILVPEKHDWALMKMTRLYEKDIADIQEVSETIGFDRHVFLRRFIEEMTHIEPSKRLVQDFLAMMQELYGGEEARRMEEEIRKKWNL